MLFKEGIVLQLAPNLTTFFFIFTWLLYTFLLCAWSPEKYEMGTAEVFQNPQCKDGASVQRGQDSLLTPQSSESLLTLGILKLLDSWRLEGLGKWRLIQFNTYLLGQQ